MLDANKAFDDVKYGVLFAELLTCHNLLSFETTVIYVQQTVINVIKCGPTVFMK